MLLLIIAVVIAQREKPPPAATIPTASVVEADSPVSLACIHAMLDAAQRGDVAGYRDCFSGELLRSLGAQLDGKNSTQDPGKRLQNAVTDLKGVATSRVEFLPPDKAEVVMELIYADHNARQQVSLRKIDGQWKIDAWTDSHRLRPDILYGTPVTKP